MSSKSSTTAHWTHCTLFTWFTSAQGWIQASFACSIGLIYKLLVPSGKSSLFAPAKAATIKSAIVQIFTLLLSESSENIIKSNNQGIAAGMVVGNIFTIIYCRYKKATLLFAHFLYL
jgi:hypothetical protein